VGDVMFDDFWQAYPHCKRPRRSKMEVARGIFKQITTTGRKTIVDGIPLYVQATPEQLVAAAKAYAEDVDNDFEIPSNEARQYVPGSHVWLNQSRHSEWIEEIEESKIRIVK
jgi:hypothetical protein